MRLVTKNSKGEFVTNTLTISKLLNRPHKSCLTTIRSQINNGELAEEDMQLTSYVSSMGRRFPAYELNKEAFEKILPFLSRGGTRTECDAITKAFARV